MTSTDMDMIKEIPGYKVILKTVLKSQIQQLVEQLASYTDEESVILTASISDGTLSHLGSDSGKYFLSDHEDIKSQFLGFCLKRHHAKIAKEQFTPSPAGHPWQAHISHEPGTSPRGRFGITPNNRKRTPCQSTSPGVKSVRHEPYQIHRQEWRSVDNVKSGSDTHNSSFKSETGHSTNMGRLDTSFDGNSQPIHQNTGNLTNSSDGDNNINADNTNLTVKHEPAESDTDLEITGIELGKYASGDINMSQGYEQMQPQNIGTPPGYNHTQPLNTSQGYDSPGATGNPEDLQAQPSAGSWSQAIDARKYPCEVCEKAFRTKQHLQRHMLIHTGQKPYPCPICQKSFRQESHRNTHMVIHYGQK